MIASPDSTQYLSTLHKQIDQYFSLSEVRTVCFDLGVDYENVPGDHKSAFIRNLLLSLARRERLQELIEILRKERPRVDWQDVPPNFVLPASIAREDISQVNQYTVYGDVIHGDQIGGDKISGDKISVGNISDSDGIAIGKGASTNFNKAQQTPIQQDTYADLEDFREISSNLENLTGVPDLPPSPPDNDPPNDEPLDDDIADEPDTPETITNLTQRHGVDIHLAQTNKPWLLPVNALVISVGVQGGMQGGLSQALRGELGEDMWQALREQVQKEVSTINPETPVLITLDSSLGPQILPNAPELPDGTTTYQIIAATPARPNSDVLSPEIAANAIIKLAIDNNITQLAIPLLGSGRGKLNSVRVVEGMVTAIYWAIPDTGNPLQTVTLTTRPNRTDVVTAAQNTINLLTANRAQKLSADSATGEDALGIKTELYALAETLLLRDVETPLAVGILGGWGSGKSFAMHLMQQEMMRIRSLNVSKGWQADSSEPYVGHIYPIEFNAWTFAKSDLWASLMQTIFMDLNKQLSLEQLFDKERMLKGGANWLELNQLGEKERLALLQSEVGKDTVAAWQRGERQDSLWKAYHEMRSVEVKQMETAVAERQQLESDLEDLQTTFQTKQEQIPEEARQTVWQDMLKTAVFSFVASEIQNTLRDQTYTTADGKVVPVFTDADLEDLSLLGIKLKQFRPTMTSMWQSENLQESLSKNKWFIITAVFFITISLLFAYFSGVVEKFSTGATATSLTAFFTAASSLALAAFRTYQQWSDEIQRWANGIQDVQDLAQDMLETQEDQIWQETQKNFNKEKAKLEQEINQLTTKIEDHRQRMGIAGQFTSLFDFVSSRLAVGDYEERLGMLHRAQADLQELTDTLTVHGDQDLHASAKQKFFPRGPARVVLFIDDLDRCPPAKVVEVLEAVQLLLRTKLFVIVLGLDTRYVTRALEKQYAGILQHFGDPSGLDYIEKIIQIPYRVRPIEPNNLTTFLEAQMEIVAQTPEEEEDGNDVISVPLDTQEQPTQEGEGAAKGIDQESVEALVSEGVVTGDTQEESEHIEPEPEAISPQIVKFHLEEFADLEQACVSLGLTPRSIKRLINVLKLIKVFWFRTNQSKNQEEIRTVINLLTLSARYPEIMAQVFHNIEMAYRDSSKGEDPLSNYLIENLGNGSVLQQMGAYKTAVTNLNFNSITLNDLGLSTFHLVRSFSFVGDPVYTEAKT